MILFLLIIWSIYAGAAFFVNVSPSDYGKGSSIILSILCGAVSFAAVLGWHIVRLITRKL